MVAAVALLAGTAQAASSAYTARWTDTLNSPTVIVDASFSFDAADYSFVAGTDWWYDSGRFSGLTVTVTGSALPAANGVFTQSMFDWLHLGSTLTSPTPVAALTAPDITFALGANGSGGSLAPSTAGGGGVMQVGSGGAGGAEYVYFRFLAPVSAVPEASSYAMALAGITVIALMASRQRRRLPTAATA